MHVQAEYGIAAHWMYKRRRDGKMDERWSEWVKQLMDIHADEDDAREFWRTSQKELFEEEVFVFTPKGEVKTLPAGATPIDFAYAVHTDVGHRTVGAKVNGRIVPLHYRLKNGDIVEILTAKSGRGPSRDWLSLAAVVAGAEQDPPVVLADDARGGRAEGPRVARDRAQEAEPAVPQDRRLGAARPGDPRDRATRRPRTSTSRSARGSSSRRRS